ncbi:MAG: hypothetical protein HRU19_05820 [Pseudobacteriovorax sp.]|nr:hypothetical protein [Pseudobacteriovorax sp.]
MDHGIELPEHRVKQNESPMGNIHVECQVESSAIEIRYSDDGRGLPIKELADKVAAETPALDDLVFQTGFSTAKTVSDISGRGVGLAAIKSEIEEKGGSITMVFGNAEVEDYKPFTFLITLPHHYFDLDLDDSETSVSAA